MSKKVSIKLPARVVKVIPPIDPAEPPTIQIEVEGAEHLYREIRIDNRLETEDGKIVQVKEGATIEVIIEAAPEAVSDELKPR
jgi:hypothetical protein